jgi:FeS assembly SUF system protein
VSTDSDKPVSPVGSADTETPSGVSANGSPIDQIKARVIEAQVIEVLRTVYDPEIPVNIYELGLVYTIEVQPDNRVNIRMTLTSPACPVAGSLPPEVESKVKAIDGVTDAKVEVVWDPPWDADKMDDAAKLKLGML